MAVLFHIIRAGQNFTEFKRDASMIAQEWDRCTMTRPWLLGERILIPPKSAKPLQRAGSEKPRRSSPIWDGCHTHAADQDRGCQHVVTSTLLKRLTEYATDFQ